LNPSASSRPANVIWPPSHPRRPWRSAPLIKSSSVSPTLASSISTPNQNSALSPTWRLNSRYLPSGWMSSSSSSPSAFGIEPTLNVISTPKNLFRLWNYNRQCWLSISHWHRESHGHVRSFFIFIFYCIQLFFSPSDTIQCLIIYLHPTFKGRSLKFSYELTKRNRLLPSHSSASSTDTTTITDELVLDIWSTAWVPPLSKKRKTKQSYSLFLGEHSAGRHHREFHPHQALTALPLLFLQGIHLERKCGFEEQHLTGESLEGFVVEETPFWCVCGGQSLVVCASVKLGCDVLGCKICWD